MVIQELKPSKRVQGRWLAVLEDGSILRLGENEIIDFALCAGKELTEEEAEGLMASLHRSGLKEKALSLLARKPQSRKELERKLSQWEATQEEAAAICERMAELGYLCLLYTSYLFYQCQHKENQMSIHTEQERQGACQKGFKTMCGGQALIEGIMMRGPKKQSVVVRRPDGEPVSYTHLDVYKRQ